MSSIITLWLTKYSASAIYNCLAINKLIGNLAHVHGLTKLPTTLNGNLFMNIISFSCMCYCCVLLSEWKVAFARISRNVILYISDVRYEIFYILPITIITHRICHNVIIIAICFSSPVWMIVEIQMTKHLEHKLPNVLHYRTTKVTVWLFVLSMWQGNFISLSQYCNWKFHCNNLATCGYCNSCHSI